MQLPFVQIMMLQFAKKSLTIVQKCKFRFFFPLLLPKDKISPFLQYNMYFCMVDVIYFSSVYL